MGTMRLDRALFFMNQGQPIRRPHWKPNIYLMQEEWQGILVATMHHYYSDRPFKAIYGFPLEDVRADDWEVIYPIDLKVGV